MKLVGVVVVAGALAVAGGVGSAGAASSGMKSCPTGYSEGRTATALKVKGETCGKARTVVTKVVLAAPQGCIKIADKKGRLSFKKPCVQVGFTCTAKGLNNRLALSVTCTRGAGRQITFRY